MSFEITSKMQNWVLEIDENVSKMKNISTPEKKVESVYKKGIIYRLDETIREKFSESDYYTPRIVSFGPYYHGHPSCKSTEQRKKNVLVYFLKRSNKKLERYIKVLKRDFASLKQPYNDLDAEWQRDDDAFVQLMILDSCFFLEVAREACRSFEADRLNINYYSDNPVWDIDGFSMVELREHYIHDMLLLENQIPMKILYKSCQVEFNYYYEAVKQLNNTVCRLPSPLPWARHQPGSSPYGVAGLYRDNLLGSGDYCRSNYLRILFVLSNYFKILLKSVMSYFRSNSTSTTELPFNIPSAMELEKVGIRFITSETMTPRDIWFKSRTLKLPRISVDGATKSIFINIIVMERLYRFTDKEITSYVYLMSRLLRREDDVKLLESHGIIHSALHFNEIIEVFDNVTTKSFMHNPDSFLESRYKLMGGNLRKYYNKRSKGWRRDLWQNYLRSPFGIISVIVAFLIFVFTGLQTIYTIAGYYNSK